MGAPEAADKIERIADSITEVSKHARNVLLTQASLAAFLLLAAAGDREATLEREKAEYQQEAQARKARAASAQESDRERQLGRSRSESRRAEEALERLVAERDAAEKVLTEAGEKFERETHHDLGQRNHEEPIAEDSETAARRLDTVRNLGDKLRESGVYVAALKGPRTRQARAKRQLDDLVETEKALAALAENPTLQPSLENLEAAVRIWALSAPNGVIDPRRVDDKLSVARGKLPAARSEWIAAKRAFERAVAAHPALWREVQDLELEARMLAARIARFDGVHQELPPAAVDTDSTVAQLFASFQDAMQRAEDKEQERKKVRAEVAKTTDVVSKAERLLQGSRDAALKETTALKDADDKLKKAKEFEASSSLKLPLVDIAIKPRDFFLLAPGLLFLVFLYLRAYVGELVRRLAWFDGECDAAGWSSQEREQALHPWLVNFTRYRWSIARLLGPVSVDWLAPTALLALCWIYARTLHPDRGYVAYMLVVATVSFALSLRAAYCARSWTSLPLVRISNGRAGRRRLGRSVLRLRARIRLLRRR